MYTDEEKLREIDRELEMRRHVYPKFINGGRMPVATAERQIGILVEIRQDYLDRLGREDEPDPDQGVLAL